MALLLNLDCLNQEIMVTTLKKFPIGRRIQVAEKFEGIIRMYC